MFVIQIQIENMKDPDIQICALIELKMNERIWHLVRIKDMAR